MVAIGEKSAFAETLLEETKLEFHEMDLSTGRPTQMPFVPDGKKLVCGFDQIVKMPLFVIESVEDMQGLWDKYAQGWATDLRWYYMPVTHVVIQ